jgi:hypothetical protein
MNMKFLTIFVVIAALLAFWAHFGKIYEGLTGNDDGSSSNTNIMTGSDTPPVTGAYNHFTKQTGDTLNGTYQSQNGNEGSIDVVNSDTLQLNLPDGKVVTLSKKEENKEGFTSSAYGTFAVYKGPDGTSATAVSGADGQTVIRVKKPTGEVTYYVKNVSSAGSSSSYFGSSGSSSFGSGSSGSKSGSFSSSSGSSTNYMLDTTPNPISTSSPYPGTSSYNTYSPPNDYTSALPRGIPGSMIPPGQEDLYILKSEVVPPVCPKCPSFFGMGGSKYKDPKKCPPCPACARCPEPSFECKKVPNYNAVNNMTLPVPVLSDFSTFGM